MNASTNPSEVMSSDVPWTLTECRDDGGAAQTLHIAESGFTVGRAATARLTVDSGSVSKLHAIIEIIEGRPVVQDQGSTNGTFVNGRQVSEAPLTNGDIVQFADKMYRVGRPQNEEFSATIEGDALPWASALIQFDELMSGNGVVPHFQPIVELPDGKICAYELLARSELEGLENPYKMFTTAARLGQECHLSELMRREGVRDALQLPSCENLFLNTHPKEIIQPAFLESLHELRRLTPQMAITIELHEAAVTKTEEMQTFKALLDELDMKLAYDDFGAGQARLDELTEVPPDYLKFDIKLIREIDTASASRQGMVEKLVQMVRDLGVLALAEGIETEGESKTCTQMGFQLAQGFYFGRPASLKALQS